MIAHFKKSVSLLIAVILLTLPFYILSTPRQAEAQVCILAAASWVLGQFGVQMALTAGGTKAAVGNTAIAVPVSNLPQNIYSTANSMGQSVQGAISGVVSWKECVLDPLAWLAKTIVIEAITTAIVDWINSGFEGSPVFMTDLSGFMLDVADKVAGEFIFCEWQTIDGKPTCVGESPLSFLCSPFQLDIQIKLSIAWYSKWGSEGSYCKLSDIVTNIDNFLNGDFMDGGWEGFAKMNNYPSGNPQGSFLQAAEQLAITINGKTFEEDTLLARAFNWLSPRDPNGKVMTPGKYVENELNSWTDSPLGQLEVADEVDEIISALFTYLTQEILTGDTGLRGVSEGYTDEIRNGRSLACEASKQDLIDRINATIASERARGRTTYIAELEELLARAQAVQCDPLDYNYPSLLGDIDNALTDIKSRIAIDDLAIACSNGIDDDLDGKTDYNADPTLSDPGCTSAADTDETDSTGAGPQCSDGIDNDGGGAIDLLDPGCTDAADNDESDGPPDVPPAGLPQCSDGIDNDDDALRDFPADPGCTSATDTTEGTAAATQCSDGIDNDGDTFIDLADPECAGDPTNDDEGVLPDPPAGAP